MKVEVHNKLGNPQVIEATRVVVYDKFDNPIALAVEYNEGDYFVSTCEHPDFNHLLRNLGIDKFVVVRDVVETPLDQIAFKPLTP